VPLPTKLEGMQMDGFVIKNEDGLYLDQKTAWESFFTEDINKARLYRTEGSANNSKKSIYNGTHRQFCTKTYLVVPVKTTRVEI